MISKARLLLIMLLICMNQSVNADFPLAALMTQFSSHSSASARFSEEKQLALLEVPLLLEGILTYRAPDYLKKEIHKPQNSLFEISGDLLHIETGNEQRTLSLDSHPLLRAFAESYRATLSGNGAALEKYFETELTGTRDRWSLHMLPRDDEVRTHIESILMTGSGSNILSIKTVETSGDTSLMTIIPDND
jgi:hypothetical protein